MEKKLYRMRKGRMLAGVATGLAEYLDMDPTIMRLIIVLVSLANFSIGVIGYIIAALVIPEKPESGAGDAGSNDGEGGTGGNDGKGRGYDSRYLLGGVLLIIGVFLLSRQLFPWFIFFKKLFWPTLLIAVGLVIIFKGWRR